MNNVLRQARYAGECFVIGVLLAIIASVLFAMPAHAQEQPTVASVALSTRIPAKGHTTPDSVHVVNTQQVPAAEVGGTCDVTVTGANNESVHPNSDILVESANVVTIHDVEREAGATNLPADGTLTLGDTVTVSVRLGEDGLFSGGTLVVDFSCTSPPPPPTTTVPPTSPPHSVPNVTCVTPSGKVVVTNPENAHICQPPQTTTVPPKCVDNPATPNNECGLPRTGPSAAGPLGIAAAGLVAGGAMLATRRPRKVTR